jgi:hypothetical protein
MPVTRGVIEMPAFNATVRIFAEDRRRKKVVDGAEIDSNAGPNHIEILATTQEEADKIWARYVLSALISAADDARKHINKDQMKKLKP